MGLDAFCGQRQELGYLDADSIFVALRRPYEIGLRLNFTYFPNAIAGHRIGLCGMLLEPVLVNDRDGLYFEMDFGLAAYTDPYRRTPDPRNVFIGSYLNCMVEIGPTYIHYNGNGSRILAGARFVHSSNGYLKKPNKGLNYLQATVGYSPSIPGNKTCRRVVVMDSAHYRGGDFLISYAPGIVMPRYTGYSHNYFYANTARVGWLYNFTPCRAAGATLDVTYNFSHTAVIRHHNENYNLPFYVGIAAAYETSWDHWALHAAMAAYLLRSVHGTTPLYERVGLFYHFGDGRKKVRHFVGVSLKSHMAHIDFIEWHYGIKLSPRNW